MSENRKPIGIKLENCENVTLTDNKGYGDIDLIVAKDSKNIVGSGNELVNEHSDISDASRLQWYQKPIGIIGITVVSGLLVSIAILVINHYSGLSLG